MFGVIFLLLFPLLSQGEVSSFTNCNQFFVNGVPPTIFKEPFRYWEICQCLLDQNNKKTFFYATLYDITNKIPVYSAYVFHHAKVERKDYWYIEPQLEGDQHDCMVKESSIHAVGHHQALNNDYGGIDYDKGHLYPVYHTSTKEAMEATSTLTNAAPQDSCFNRIYWWNHEKELAKHLKASCTGPSFIVTGVVPGIKTIGNNVRVAKFYWSAFCCTNTRYSGASIGPDQNGKVEDLTVSALETRLSDNNHYGQPFSVFPGNC